MKLNLAILLVSLCSSIEATDYHHLRRVQGKGNGKDKGDKGPPPGKGPDASGPSEDQDSESINLTEDISDAIEATLPLDPCAAFPCGNNDKKYMVCHLPSGDPMKAKTLCLGSTAGIMATHPDNYCGECATMPPEEEPTTIPPTTEEPTTEEPLESGTVPDEATVEATTMDLPQDDPCTGNPFGEDGSKFLVCHFPSGDPSKAKTLCLGSTIGHMMSHSEDLCGECPTSDMPSDVPSDMPSDAPSLVPSDMPSDTPSSAPSA